MYKKHLVLFSVYCCKSQVWLVVCIRTLIKPVSIWVYGTSVANKQNFYMRLLLQSLSAL